MILRNLYFGIFSSVMTYGSQIWGQNQNIHVRRITKLQNKAMRIINFSNFDEPSSHLYKSAKILKFKDNLMLQIFLYVHDSFTSNIPSNLQQNFSYIHTRHNYLTRNNKMKCVNLPVAKTYTYGINSINGQSSRNWNFINITLFNDLKTDIKRNEYKAKIKNHFLQSY